MSSDPINPKALGFIYTENLYRLANKEQTVNREEKKQDLVYHGANLKNVLVMIDDSKRVFSGLEYALLTKILKAISLDINDVAVVDAFDPSSSMDNLKDQLKPKLILSFGNSFPQVSGGLNELSEQEGISCLITHSLQDLESNLDMKRALWNGLKSIPDKLDLNF